MPYDTLSNKEMAPEKSNMKAVSEIEALQSRLERLLRDDPILADSIKELLRHAAIKREYRKLIKNRWGESAEIKLELSLKYYNTPYKVHFIHDVIYRKYR